MDVSIIIVNWNTRDILRGCLRSICEQTEPGCFEVIVVDNGSQDGSVEMVRREFPAVRLIANAENRGFAAANNQGMAVARGRYILLLNSDTVVLDDAIGKTVRFAEACPQAAVVGCRVLNPDHSLQPTCFMYPSLLNMLLAVTYLYKLFPQNRFLGRERMGWWGRDDVRDVQVVTGCFMLVRRAALEQVGGLDERFYVYGEETDWCYRFRQAGWRVVFAPVADIVHYGGTSSRQRPAQMTLQLRGSILLFFRKHRRWPTYVAARLFTAAFFLPRVPYWLGKAALAPAQRGHCLSVARTYFIGGCKSILGMSLCVRE